MPASPEEPTVAQLTYDGPFEAVNVLALGATVKRGVPTEVADPALAAQLLAQGWSEVKPKRKPTTPADEASTKEKP